MSATLTDEHIAKCLASLHGRLLMGAEQELQLALLELQQHRARIAKAIEEQRALAKHVLQREMAKQAHAAAHPERLSEEQIQSWAVNSRFSDVSAMAVEIQHRRAADLTPPQLDQVRAMLLDAVADRPIVCGLERIEILWDILRAHGAAP